MPCSHPFVLAPAFALLLAAALQAADVPGQLEGGRAGKACQQIARGITLIPIIDGIGHGQQQRQHGTSRGGSGHGGRGVRADNVNNFSLC